MNSINTPSTRVAEATIASTADAPSPTAAPIISATSFSHYQVLGDGDCLFRAMYMGLANQPGVEPSQDQVMSLRQYLADYVYQHQQTLADNPAFEGRQGVLNLYDLLLTPGQWNHNTGDLVAPLLAQVSGRPLAVLQPAKGGAAYHVRQVFPAENPTLPPGTVTTGEPTVCLAHINGNHYGYLEERYPNVLANALAQSANVSALDQASSGTRLLEKNNNEYRPSFQKINKGRLTTAKKQELAQLWLSNPSWGERKIANEFMKRNPNLSITRSVVHCVKARHPELRGLTLGSMMKSKKCSESEEKALVQIWLRNPSWGASRVVSEFKKNNPESVVTASLLHNLKLRHPDLKGMGIGSFVREVKLNDLQQAALLQLCRSKPKWGYQRITQELNKLYPGMATSLGRVRSFMSAHASERKLPADAKKINFNVNNDQEKQLLQLYREHPHWDHCKVVDEFAKRNPNLDLPHLNLKSLDFDYRKGRRKLNDEQEKEVVNLWLKNPTWGEIRVAREYRRRNPGQPMTRGVAGGLRLRHPALRGVDIGGGLQLEQKLNDVQRKALIDLCLKNTDWGNDRIAQEFNKHNPNTMISRSFVYRLREKHPNLNNDLIMQSIKHAPPAQRHGQIKRKLSALAKKMQGLRAIAQSDEQAKSRYQNLKAQVDMLQAYAANLSAGGQEPRRDPLVIGGELMDSDSLLRAAPRQATVAQEAASSESTFAALSDIYSLNNLGDDEQGSVDYMPEEDTHSQGTFASLSDIAELDDMLSEPYDLSDSFDDACSQGTFADLDDLEEISSLKD